MGKILTGVLSTLLGIAGLIDWHAVVANPKTIVGAILAAGGMYLTSTGTPPSATR